MNYNSLIHRSISMRGGVVNTVYQVALATAVRVLCLVLFTFIFAGCFKESFKDDRIWGKVTISTDWGDLADIPGGIVVYFYPESNPHDSLNIAPESLGKPIIEYISNKGAEITLPLGNYYAFAYNDYSEDLLFRNMDMRTAAEVYLNTESKVPFSKLNSGVEYISEMEDFYKCQIGSFELNQKSLEYEVLIRPRLKTITLELDIPIDGIHNVVHARGSMSSVGKSLNLSMGKTDINQVASIVFDFDITSTGISARIKCFGIPSSQGTKSRVGEELKNILEVAFILRDNSSIIGEHIFDVTDNITYEVAENGGYIPYTGSRPLIEDVVIENDGGFQVEVGDWEDVNEDLIVND